jgi:hypothetical protein
MNLILILFIVSIISSPIIIDEIHAQTTIDVGESTPCFLDYTAGVDMWANCGMETDPLGAVTLPFEWISGGYFSLLIVGLIMFTVYIKYQTALYPVAIGIVMLPTSYFLIPVAFFSFLILMIGITVAAGIYYMLVSSNKV